MLSVSCIQGRQNHKRFNCLNSFRHYKNECQMVAWAPELQFKCIYSLYSFDDGLLSTDRHSTQWKYWFIQVENTRWIANIIFGYQGVKPWKMFSWILGVHPVVSLDLKRNAFIKCPFFVSSEEKRKRLLTWHIIMKAKPSLTFRIKRRHQSCCKNENVSTTQRCSVVMKF